MPKAKVVFIGPHGQIVKGLVESTPEGFSLATLPDTASEDEMIREVEDADFLMLRYSRTTTYPDSIYRAGKRLKLIQTMGTGYDWLPLPLLRELGSPLANIGRMNAIGGSSMPLP